MLVYFTQYGQGLYKLYNSVPQRRGGGVASVNIHLQATPQTLQRYTPYPKAACLGCGYSTSQWEFPKIGGDPNIVP